MILWFFRLPLRQGTEKKRSDTRPSREREHERNKNTIGPLGVFFESAPCLWKTHHVGGVDSKTYCTQFLVASVGVWTQIKRKPFDYKTSFRCMRLSLALPRHPEPHYPCCAMDYFSQIGRIHMDSTSGFLLKRLHGIKMKPLGAKLMVSLS